MRQRRKSLAKILVLQEQLNKLSAWKLAALDQERATLEETRRATIEAIDRAAISGGLLVNSGTRHLHNIERRMAKVKVDHLTQTQHAREQAMRAKLVERLVENVDAKYRMQQERADLNDLIERSVAKQTTSPA